MIKKLTERLNFSTDRKLRDSVGVVSLNPRVSTDGNNQLSLYCANNDIDPRKISEGDWWSACEIYEEYMKSAAIEYDEVYFWIDN